MFIKQMFNSWIKKYKSQSLILKISFFISTLSFFLSYKPAILLCVISTLIVIIDHYMNKSSINKKIDIDILAQKTDEHFLSK